MRDALTALSKAVAAYLAFTKTATKMQPLNQSQLRQHRDNMCAALADAQSVLEMTSVVTEEDVARAIWKAEHPSAAFRREIPAYYLVCARAVLVLFKKDMRSR